MARGKWNGRKRRRDNGGGGREREDKRSRDGEGWEHYAVERRNIAFEEYYRKQGICAEDEFETFLKELRVPLGTGFRIVAADRMRAMVMEKIENEYKHAFEGLETEEGMVIRPLEQLKWYPDGLGWTCNVPRPVLRKNEALKGFFNFMKAQNSNGTINRQEVVSMIPPLLLNVKPGQRIIDLCAAPGSKTAQILDAVADFTGKCRSSLVVANDADLKRCNTLCHQLKRFSCRDLVVTNHRAEQFPSVVKFDRVLCDVPCSGDGTIRKAPDMWGKWSPSQGNGLHKVQVAIASRGFQLLQTGGRMVFSTCTFNPIENEAVVATLVEIFRDSISVVDVSSELVGLKRRKGMSSWWVKDTSKDGGWYSKYEEVPEARRGKIIPSMFPPPKENRSSMLLDRCLRLFPHDQDTGGFFVAVLEKKGQESEASTVLATDDVEAERGPPQGMPTGRNSGYSNLLANDPLVSVRESAPDVAKQIQSFYGIHDDWIIDGIHSKGSESGSRRLYLISDFVRRFLDATIYKTERKAKLRAILAGLRAFERCPREDASCDYRIVLEAVPLLLPHLTKRVVKLDKATFLQLISADKSIRIDALVSEDIQKQLRALEIGSVIFQDEESSDILVFWRGNSQLSTLMPKTDLQTVRLKHEIVVAEPTNDEQAIEEEEDHDVIKHEDPQGEKIDAANQGEDPEEGLAKDEEDVADESTSVALNPKATHTEPRDPSTTNDCKAP